MSKEERMRTRFLMTGALATAMAVMSLTMTVAAQAPTPGSKPDARSQKPAARKAYSLPKTPWGDPDISGVLTNNDESGIPLERPNQFEGKRIEDVSESELEELRNQRENQRVAAAPNLGGIPGTNPVHWFENFGAKNSRAWLLVDPPDGRIPARTQDAQSRPPQR